MNWNLRNCKEGETGVQRLAVPLHQPHLSSVTIGPGETARWRTHGPSNAPMSTENSALQTWEPPYPNGRLCVVALTFSGHQDWSGKLFWQNAMQARPHQSTQLIIAKADIEGSTVMAMHACWHMSPTTWTQVDEWQHYLADQYARFCS